MNDTRTYTIRVNGHLDLHWSPRLAELAITHHRDGTSSLTGRIADQAQLHGVLASLRDIGAVLIDLHAAGSEVEPAQDPANPQRPTGAGDAPGTGLDMTHTPNDSPQQGTREVPAPQNPSLHAPTRAEQRTARIMGAWFLGTFLFSIPAFFFYDPILNDVDYVVGSGEDTRIGVGGLLEILLAVSGIATAVVIYPIVKRVRQSVALGYIASRTVESMLILVGVLSLMAMVALHQDLDATASTNETLEDVGQTLVALHEQTRLLGPQFCAGLGNGILLGYLMWRSRLLPRPMVIVGLVGGPLALVAGIGVLVGAWETTSGLPVALTAPEAIWELSLSVWLLVKGFRPSPILTGTRV